MDGWVGKKNELFHHNLILAPLQSYSLISNGRKYDQWWKGRLNFLKKSFLPLSLSWICFIHVYWIDFNIFPHLLVWISLFRKQGQAECGQRLQQNSSHYPEWSKQIIVLNTAKSIFSQPRHHLFTELRLFPSGYRYSLPTSRTNRLRKSLLPWTFLIYEWCLWFWIYILDFVAWIIIVIITFVHCNVCLMAEFGL